MPETMPPPEHRGMPSPRLLRGRHSELSAWYAVTTVAARRRPVFIEPGAAEAVRLEIANCEREGIIESEAWVLMPDHLHWLFRLRAASLGRCMQAFKSRSARAIRELAGGSGPIWQRGYYDHRVRGDEDLFAQAKYIIANPLRGNLVGRGEDYPHWWARHASMAAE